MKNHSQDEIRSAAQDADFNLPETEAQSGHTMAARRFAWEAVLRAMFLLFVTGGIVFLAWRPGVWRFNFAFTFGNPLPGDRLAWRAEDDRPVRKIPVPGSPRPPEWRLSANNFTNWHNPRIARYNLDLTSKSLVETDWRRETRNAWNWEDDVAPRFHRESAGFPPQLPMTSFRAGDMLEWPKPAVEERPEPEAFPALPVIAPQTAPRTDAAPATAPGAATVEAGPGPGPVTPPELPPVPQRREPAAARTDVPPEAPILLGGESAPERAVEEDAAPIEVVDWKNREITGPIPDAFLTIYPKLRFVGLCLPGQGYIRSYHQIGVPEHLEGGKTSAHDGRVPHGRYYIADRYRDSDGPRLFLSWPSPEDARRIGLDPIRQAEVENAWRRRELPPQDTDAGGGVGITGLRRWVDVTEGGFALEEPQMEEIFTALPDKAWVIIQDN